MGSVGITVDLMKRGSRREQKNCHAAGIHSAWCAAVGTGAGAIAELGLSALWGVKDIGAVGPSEQQSQERSFCFPSVSWPASDT